MTKCLVEEAGQPKRLAPMVVSQIAYFNADRAAKVIPIGAARYDTAPLLQYDLALGGAAISLDGSGSHDQKTT